MESSVGLLGHNGENTELVTARVHTDPIAEMLSDGYVSLNVFSESCEVSLIVDALLELPDESWGHGTDDDAPVLQLLGDDVVGDGVCWRFCLINGDFKIQRCLIGKNDFFVDFMDERDGVSIGQHISHELLFADG